MMMHPALRYILNAIVFNLSMAFAQTPQPGCYSLDLYLDSLTNKRVALVGNQTSLIDNKHLIDTLLQLHINVTKVFAPEHGFRGTAGAGETIKNSKDEHSGVQIISLYGKHFKPKASDFKDVDVVLFDIQDVGVRFYTYLSTLHYIMEACAENHKKLIVLDRPNPNGDYIDGPVLDLKYKSFVGLHPIPIVYGLTIGEYALMINGEKWLKNQLRCNLEVVPCQHYTHATRYVLPVKPSPNLPNALSVRLYPSLALFEGTAISVGRGTDMPFQVYGHPALDSGTFVFQPLRKLGAPMPLYADTLCRGVDLTNLKTDPTYFSITYLMAAYQHFPDKEHFFKSFFYNLSGNTTLRNQIEQGVAEEVIRKSWQHELDDFKVLRNKYLLYE